MSAYTRCYSCGCDSVNVDNADACDCDFHDGGLHNGVLVPWCDNHRKKPATPRPLSPEEKALAEAVEWFSRGGIVREEIHRESVARLQNKASELVAAWKREGRFA